MKAGLSAHLTHKVTERNLVTNWSNDVPVLATPILLWLSERAYIQAIELERTEISVGVGHNAEHLAPTPLDFTVTIQATEEVRGNRLIFDVEGHDGRDLILKGVHVHQVVDKNRFMVKVRHKVLNG